MWLTVLAGLLTASPSSIPSRAAGHQDPCVPSRSAYGPAFVIPFELAQGVTLGRGSPAPFAASARVYPTYMLDRRAQLRVAAAVGGALVNPKLEALIGGRVTKSVFEINAGPIRGVGAHLGLEALYGTSDRALAGVMLIADAGGLFQGTLRADQDLTNGATVLELGVGLHLYEGPTPEAPQVMPAPPRDYLGRVAERMAIDVKATIGTVRDEGVAACRDLVSKVRRFVRQHSPGVTTVDGFRSALSAQGLDRVATDMTEPDPPPPGTTEAQVVQALYRGMADGVGIQSGP